jgi:hypothetical protein
MSWRKSKPKRPGSGKMRRTLTAAGGTLDGKPTVMLSIGTEQAMITVDDWDGIKNWIDGLFRVAALKGGVL